MSDDEKIKIAGDYKLGCKDEEPHITVSDEDKLRAAGEAVKDILIGTTSGFDPAQGQDVTAFNIIEPEAVTDIRRMEATFPSRSAIRTLLGFISELKTTVISLLERNAEQEKTIGALRQGAETARPIPKYPTNEALEDALTDLFERQCIDQNIAWVVFRDLGLDAKATKLRGLRRKYAEYLAMPNHYQLLLNMQMFKTRGDTYVGVLLRGIEDCERE